MKSVLQAGWLLTVAVGNIIVLIVAGAGQFSEQVQMQTEITCTSVLSVDDPPCGGLVTKSCPTLVTPWTRQAPLSIGFSRQEYWSGLPFPVTYIHVVISTSGQITPSESARQSSSQTPSRPSMCSFCLFLLGVTRPEYNQM